MEEEVLSDLYRNGKIKILPVTNIQIDHEFHNAFTKENKNRFFFLHRHLIKEHKATIDIVKNMATKYYIRRANG